MVYIFLKWYLPSSLCQGGKSMLKYQYNPCVNYVSNFASLNYNQNLNGL